MPVKKEREYRTLVAPLVAQSSGEKRIQSECYVEGYDPWDVNTHVGARGACDSL